MTKTLVYAGDYSGQIITTSAEVTPNGGLVRESPPNPLNSGLGIIVICPDYYIHLFVDTVTSKSRYIGNLDIIHPSTLFNRVIFTKPPQDHSRSTHWAIHWASFQAWLESVEHSSFLPFSLPPFQNHPMPFVFIRIFVSQPFKKEGGYCIILPRVLYIILPAS